MLQMNETYRWVFVYPFSDIQHQGMEEKYCKSFYIMGIPFFTLYQSILNVQYDNKSRWKHLYSSDFLFSNSINSPHKYELGKKLEIPQFFLCTSYKIFLQSANFYYFLSPLLYFSLKIDRLLASSFEFFTLFYVLDFISFVRLELGFPLQFKIYSPEWFSLFLHFLSKNLSFLLLQLTD